MLKNLEGARLGLFVFIGTVLIVVSIFMIGNKESIFIRTINIKTYFSSIEGLKAGAPVWLSGYNIGSVKEVTLAPDNSGRVEVIMSIEAEVKQFIRLDSEASIETSGLVGKKIISITPGNPSLAIIPDGGTIKAKNPIKISEVVDESMTVLHHFSEISKDFADIVNKINGGEGTLGRLVNDEKLYSSTVAIIESARLGLNNVNAWFSGISAFTDTLNLGIKSIGNNVDNAISDLRGLVADVRSVNGVIGKFISDPATYDSVMTVVNNLIATTKASKEGAEKLSENMEALKHNWLFKGYFEERGYWDKSDYDKLLNQRLDEIKQQNELLNKKLQEFEKLKSEIMQKN